MTPGCSGRFVPKADDVTVRFEIAPATLRTGPASLTFYLADVHGAPITRARVEAEADMSHPGMSPQIFKVSELGAGGYQARGQFDMAGDWVILLHIALPDGSSVEKQFEVKGIQSK